MHEDPQVPNFGTPGTPPRLKAGMTLAIEPMVNAGSHEVYMKPDGWTICTVDGGLSAYFEHTVAITDKGPLILTALADAVALEPAPEPVLTANTNLTYNHRSCPSAPRS